MVGIGLRDALSHIYSLKWRHTRLDEAAGVAMVRSGQHDGLLRARIRPHEAEGEVICYNGGWKETGGRILRGEHASTKRAS